MRRIAVMSGGIGGASAAYGLNDRLGEAHEVVRVSDPIRPMIADEPGARA